MKSPTRLSLCQATHKELLRNDTQYRKRFQSYLLLMLCLCCVLLPFYLPLFGVALFGFPANLCIILSVAAFILLLTLRQFGFQRRSIRQYLGNSKGA